jgi:hypothetical protein
VSIPDPFKIFFIHLAIVFAVTGPCGGLTLTHNLSSSEPERKATVASIKVLMVSTGHNSKLENFLIEKEPNEPAR